MAIEDDKNAALEEERLRDEATKKIIAATDDDVNEIDEWLREDSGYMFEQRLKNLESDLIHIPGVKQRKTVITKPEILKPTKKYEIVIPLKEIAANEEDDEKEYTKMYTHTKANNFTRKIDKTERKDYDPDLLNDDSEKGSQDQYDDSSDMDSPTPPSPKGINLYRTVQLAKERHGILRNLGKQVNVLINGSMKI
jgi:hypothetical protein